MNTESITSAIQSSVGNVINYIPKVIGALIVILIGVVVGWLVKAAIVKVADYLNIGRAVERVGLHRVFTEKVDVRNLIGDIAKWIIIIIFLLPALDILELPQVNEVVQGMVEYIPNVLAAVFIILIGFVVADLVSRIVGGTSKTIGSRTADVLSEVAKYSIIVFAILAALVQLGIAAVLVDRLFTGIVAFVAIAGGLAFGLGGQDAAREFIEKTKKNIPK